MANGLWANKITATTTPLPLFGWSTTTLLDDAPMPLGRMRPALARPGPPDREPTASP